MNKSEFLQDAIGMIDDALLQHALTETPRRKGFRPILIAACLTVMLIAIPLGILIANRTETPEVPIVDVTTSAPITTEAPKADLFDIPGAVLFENDGSFQTTEGRGASGAYAYDLNGEQTLAFAKRVGEENKAVLGLVKSHTSVLVPDGKDYYRITKMEIAVLEDYSGFGEGTITAVYANRYEWGLNSYYPATPYTLGNATYRPDNKVVENFSVTVDMFEAALDCTERHCESYPYAALFLLKDAKDSTVTVEDASVRLSDFADYVLDACFDYDPDFDAFALFSLKIPFIFRTSLIREVFLGELSIYDGYGILFQIESNHLLFRIPKFVDFRMHETDSIFSETLFIENQVNPDHKWVLTVDGTAHEITHIDLKNTDPAIEVYLDIDFEDCETIRLDIYDSDGNLICYANLA